MSSTPRKSPRLAAKRGTNSTVAAMKLVTTTPSDEKKEKKTPNIAKLYLRGCISNGLGIAILYACATRLGIKNQVYLAAGIQLAVFLLHGLPFSSEQFYGSIGTNPIALLTGAGAIGCKMLTSLLCFSCTQTSPVLSPTSAWWPTPWRRSPGSAHRGTCCWLSFQWSG